MQRRTCCRSLGNRRTRSSRHERTDVDEAGNPTARGHPLPKHTGVQAGQDIRRRQDPTTGHRRPATHHANRADASGRHNETAWRTRVGVRDSSPIRRCRGPLRRARVPWVDDLPALGPAAPSSQRGAMRCRIGYGEFTFHANTELVLSRPAIAEPWTEWARSGQVSL